MSRSRSRSPPLRPIAAAFCDADSLVAKLYDGSLETELFGDYQSGAEEEESDSEGAVRRPSDDAAVPAQHPEKVAKMLLECIVYGTHSIEKV